MGECDSPVQAVNGIRCTIVSFWGDRFILGRPQGSPVRAAFTVDVDYAMRLCKLLLQEL